MTHGASRHHGTRHRGTVLVAAIIIVFTLAGMVMVLGRSMAVEAMASANQAASVQAASIAHGAEQYVLGIVADTTQSPLDLDESNFTTVPVGDGYFWIVRPDYSDSTMPAWGLVDENSKVDINTASYESLMRLSGMTDDVASAIVDWRDEDDTPSAGGAESQYYLSLPQPYTCKNAPFETVEEMLLVRGATPQLLYGDGTAPPLGTTSQVMQGGSGLLTDAQLARGIYDLLTIYSAQNNTTADGNSRVNVNDSNQRNVLLQVLQRQLDPARAAAIVGSISRRTRFVDVFDFYFRTRMTRDEFDKVGDFLTTTSGNRVRGRINVNTAPREVLLSIDTLTSADVDTIIGRRGSFNSGGNTLGWVIDALGQKAVGLSERLTTKSSRYSADIVAVSGNGRAFKHIRIVVDAGSAAGSSTATPKIIYRRDLTDRGWPLDPQILSSLRSGQALTSDGTNMGGIPTGGLGR